MNFKIGDEVIVTKSSHFTKAGAIGTINVLGNVAANVVFSKGQYEGSPNIRTWAVRLDELCHNTKLGRLLAGVENEV